VPVDFRATVTSKQQPHQQCAPKPRILIVTHHDGFIEIFSDTEATCLRRAMPFAGPAAELDAERFVELSLPRTWRSLLVPGCRRWTGNFRQTDHELQVFENRIVERHLLGALEAFGRNLRGEGRR
jgi:hypothetical protein